MSCNIVLIFKEVVSTRGPYVVGPPTTSSSNDLHSNTRFRADLSLPRISVTLWVEIERQYGSSVGGFFANMHQIEILRIDVR